MAQDKVDMHIVENQLAELPGLVSPRLTLLGSVAGSPKIVKSIMAPGAQVGDAQDHLVKWWNKQWLVGADTISRLV